MSIETMKLALEALELHGQQYPHMVKGYCVDAITSLRAAIEQAEKQSTNSEVEIEFTEWMHPVMGVVPVDPKTPLILKAKLKEKNA
jgi:hypothetical protein